MQITAEQMMVADIDVVRQQVIAEMTAQQPKAVLQKRLLTATQAAGGTCLCPRSRRSGPVDTGGSLS